MIVEVDGSVVAGYERLPQQARWSAWLALAVQVPTEMDWRHYAACLLRDLLAEADRRGLAL